MEAAIRELWHVYMKPSILCTLTFKVGGGLVGNSSGCCYVAAVEGVVAMEGVVFTVKHQQAPGHSRYVNMANLGGDRNIYIYIYNLYIYIYMEGKQIKGREGCDREEGGRAGNERKEGERE